jgi:hypothetical protein
MRVDTESLDPFLALLARYRPCLACGSLRVTVQRLGSCDSDPLRAQCADCGQSYLAHEPGNIVSHSTPHGDT